METKIKLKDNVQTVKDLKFFNVFQMTWQKTKRAMNGFRLSNEKIQIEQNGPQNSDRIYSLHFADGTPNKANPSSIMHMGYDTKREKNSALSFQTLITNKENTSRRK